MIEPPTGGLQPPKNDDANRARDHLANERTFFAWLRTGVAIIVFGFAIGRFAIAIREFMGAQGHVSHTPGASVWFAAFAIVAGAMLTLFGLTRYRRTRRQIETGEFEPAGLTIDVVGVLGVLFGLALAAYLIYIAVRL